jgi:uncharacterized protein (TIGR02421 family)
VTASTLAELDIDEVVERIERREGAHLELSAGGRLSIDRGLPFLLVHRRPTKLADVGTARLVAGEAAFLTAASDDASIPPLVQRVAKAGSSAYGAFLVLEIWAGADPDSHTFTVRGPVGPAPETVEALVSGLAAIAELDPASEVRWEETEERAPPDLPPLLSIHDSWEHGILYLGLEIPPIYREAPGGPLFPRFLRRLRRSLSDILREALYEFIRVQANYDLANYQALGTHTVPDSIWSADRELSAIERSFSLLILTSPANEREAWQQFRSDGYQRDPVFHYRLLPMDPDLLKRRLFAIPLEAIDDPALAYLMQDKREDLDRQLGMLAERGTPGFRYSSMRLYGTVDEQLLGIANRLLRSIPAPQSRRDGPRQRWVDAEGFREAAVGEFAYYASQFNGIESRRIEIRPDLVGLMVSEGNLLIGAGIRLSPDRVPALIHHEVGTHVLTYVNGSAQPMEQLSLGLAGYDELQEGLAVLAEYLAGGLDRFRMRLLAARVVAAHAVEQGASFVETFGLLTGGHGFPPWSAWHAVTRVHACGGFTRDLIYLRGLVSLLDHLRSGGDLRPLYLGKIAEKHIPVIEELRHRSVLREPPLTPRLLENPEALKRLETVRAGINLIDLVCPDPE